VHPTAPFGLWSGNYRNGAASGDGDKRIAARSPKPAQRLVPLPVLGLGCSLRHSIRGARAEVINQEAATGHEPAWRPVTHAGSGGGLAGDDGGGPSHGFN